MSEILLAKGADLGADFTALSHIVWPRQALRPVFREARDIISRFPKPAQQDWTEAALALQRINPGLGCSLAFFGLTVRLGREGQLRLAINAGRRATDVCRGAGASAARALLTAATQLIGLASPEADQVLEALAGLARDHPQALAEAVPVLPEILRAVGADGYGAWLATGLRAYATDRAKLIAYVALDDSLAKKSLADHGSSQALRLAIRPARLFAKAVFGMALKPHRLSGAVRSSLAPPLLLMPESFADHPRDRQADLAKAALAHAAAHQLFGGRTLFDPKGLKPVQITLTSLIEDARVERLAINRWPGLRRFWQPFHDADPKSARTVPLLMARMSRCLIDPSYRDPDPWIAKAKALLSARQDRLSDPAISREIGGLLGNDLGQMRLSFNPKTYRVEPAYRDDHLGLWQTTTPPDVQAADIELAVEMIRLREEDRDAGKPREDQTTQADGGSRPAGRERDEDMRRLITRLPEWDFAEAIERPDWVQVWAYRPTTRPATKIRANPLLVARTASLIAGSKMGRPRRLRRQADGDQLDLDRVVAAEIQRRIGALPDRRLYRRIDQRTRSLSTLLLIDSSESTRSVLGDNGKRILDMAIEAATVLGRAIDQLGPESGNRLAVDGFASNGRDDLRILPIKGFDERFDEAAEGRIAAMHPGFSTRLGAALRHGDHRFAGERAERRVIIVITDGEPFDVDCPDPTYLVEDARRAALQLRRNGIDLFALGIGPAQTSGVRLFGRGRFIPISRDHDLPRALTSLYFRLASR